MAVMEAAAETAFRLADDPEQRLAQLHVDLGTGSLESMVDDVTDVALRAVELAGGDRAVVRAALREFLHQRIVARDVCGLSAFCWGLESFDPWESEPERSAETESPSVAHGVRAGHPTAA